MSSVGEKTRKKVKAKTGMFRRSAHSLSGLYFPTFQEALRSSTENMGSVKMKAVAAQLCLTLCDPKNCSPPGSSVHGILQARILEWVAIAFSRGSS